MQSELIRVTDFCKRYAISRSTFYRLVSRGELAICKVCAGTRVKTADAEAWFASLEK